LRKTRHENFKKNIEITSNDLLNSDLAKREIASIYRCDLSLIISSFEMDLLINIFKIDKKMLHYLPFLLDKIDENDLKTFPTFAKRQHFVSIGNFRHPPNWDTVLNLKENIWKHIKSQIPTAEIHIYGAYMPETAQQLDNKKEGFIVKGRAENAHEIIKTARVLLAPIRFGAGLKGKLIDAMQTGTPFVTTKIGAEAMFCDFATNENEFIEKAISLYKNENLWKTAQQNGIEIINNHFDKTMHSPAFIGAIMALHNNLTQHRTNNFVGQMLRHHAMQSTKYMSRWIELKSQK
jgi:glycosyltransferase involved in cell wall biosynthesis